VQDGSQYSVLLIITDGVISDMAQTKEAIVNVSWGLFLSLGEAEGKMGMTGAWLFSPASLGPPTFNQLLAGAVESGGTSERGRQGMGAKEALGH
jgi:hypothetical protein